MRAWRIQIGALLSLILLLTMATSVQADAISAQDEQLTYWYEGETFDINPEDDWIPFFALTDVPHSLPLRGYVGDNRNYFLDFGAHEWLSDWIQFYYDWEISEFEDEFRDDDLLGQLEYLFETITGRLAKPQSYVDIERGYSALDYVKHLEPPYEVFIPLVVMFGLNDSYDEEGMKEWVIHQDVVEDSLNEAFPLITWETELYWFNYDEAPEFADLMEEYHQGESIMMDYEYIDRCDDILHDIFSDDSRYSEYDFVLPALVMLQDYSLVFEPYGMAVGGLGRLQSDYPEVNSWCLNGRAVYSYFFAGDPSRPRTSITPTVVHELGHCVGQTDIHSVFGWFAAASSVSAMCAYQQPVGFDRFDTDMILNGYVLQLWGKFIDEIEYFRTLALTSSELTNLQGLEMTFTQIPYLLVDSNMDGLMTIINNAETVLNDISAALTERALHPMPRMSTGWSDYGPPLDVQLDWIIGPGIPDADLIREQLESSLEENREITLFTNTTLPSPRYNVNISVHAADDEFEESLLQFLSQNLVESQTSTFNESQLPSDAFMSWPRSNIFQTQTGYAINGSVADQWLVDNPFTEDMEDKVHYRFYIMNLETLTLPSGGPGIPAEMMIVLGGGLLISVGAVAIILIRKRRMSVSG